MHGQTYNRSVHTSSIRHKTQTYANPTANGEPVHDNLDIQSVSIAYD